MTAVSVATKRASEEGVALVRCPSCDGLRGVSMRRSRDTALALCPDCMRGNVVTRAEYHQWWLDRFTPEEIRALGRAIWGSRIDG